MIGIIGVPVVCIGIVVLVWFEVGAGEIRVSSSSVFKGTKIPSTASSSSAASSNTLSTGVYG